MVARLSKTDGKIVKGTFLSSILTNGNTNTLNLEYIGTEAAGAEAPIVVYGKAAAFPVITGTKLTRDTSLTDADRVDGAFRVRYELSRNLNTILSANGKFRGEINPNAGSTDSGTTNSGTSNSGTTNSGTSNTGTTNSGTPNTDNPSTSTSKAFGAIKDFSVAVLSFTALLLIWD